MMVVGGDGCDIAVAVAVAVVVAVVVAVGVAVAVAVGCTHSTVAHVHCTNATAHVQQDLDAELLQQQLLNLIGHVVAAVVHIDAWVVAGVGIAVLVVVVVHVVVVVLVVERIAVEDSVVEHAGVGLCSAAVVHTGHVAGSSSYYGCTGTSGGLISTVIWNKWWSSFP